MISRDFANNSDQFPTSLRFSSLQNIPEDELAPSIKPQTINSLNSLQFPRLFHTKHSKSTNQCYGNFSSRFLTHKKFISLENAMHNIINFILVALTYRNIKHLIFIAFIKKIAHIIPRSFIKIARVCLSLLYVCICVGKKRWKFDQFNVYLWGHVDKKVFALNTHSDQSYVNAYSNVKFSSFSNLLLSIWHNTSEKILKLNLLPLNWFVFHVRAAWH
jgi:hypothetical protein